VTRCYATVGQGRTFDDLRRGVRNAAESVGKDTGGARVVGVALEGPYISREKCGAWNPEHLRLPSVEELHELIAASRGRIRRLNVAPELPGALELIRAAVAAGLVVSIGHSNATAEAARSGVEAGATLSNHTYNGMSGLDHRAPGLVGETLANPALTAELILDFVHVHPVAAKALIAAKGPDKVAIISDNTALAGLPDGVYEQPGRPVTVRDGAARLAGGTLAGSVSAMDRNFRHAVELMDGDLFAAVKMCCFTPARAMGAAWGPWFGYPYSSDWLVLDEHLAVIGTVVAGEVVYQRPTAAGAA
jgi:N-acetylglucosamine-6-phosphate deacetylase